MTTLNFEKPLEILIGLGFPTPIRSVFMAYNIVNDWPISGRGRMHSEAVSACRMALNGRAEATEARAAFEAFAIEAGILVENADTLVAAAATGSIPVSVSDH